MRSTRLSALLVVVSLSAGAHAAGKDDPEVKLVKDMIRDAVAAEKAGRCKDALSVLRQAAAIRETAEVLLHVGECQAKDGALIEAQKTWENAVSLAKTEKDKA